MRDTMSLRPTLTSTPKRPLPFYVEPAHDEALFSWLMRLATAWVSLCTRSPVVALASTTDTVVRDGGVGLTHGY